MKLLFLIRQETQIKNLCAFYDFLPYKYGPYSFFADRDLRHFIERGQIQQNPNVGIVEEHKREIEKHYYSLPYIIRGEINQLIYQNLSEPDNKLIDRVYMQYPEYTVLSERENKRFLPLSPQSKRTIASPAVYTIGYENSSVDAFLNALIVYGMSRLIDIRNNPLSRRFGFSKRTLSNLCEKIGIEYVHFPELGIKSEDRKSLSDFESYRKLLNHYEKNILPHKIEALNQTVSLIKEKSSVFMCFEKDAQWCHRGRVANKISNMTRLPIYHLGVTDARKKESSYYH
jgi:uncharacterized protein (DUF488 family)